MKGTFNQSKEPERKKRGNYSCNVMNRSINEAFEKGIADDARFGSAISLKLLRISSKFKSHVLEEFSSYV